MGAGQLFILNFYSNPPMKGEERNKLLAFAARLYYQEGFSQSEVARVLSVSQAKVSRLLKEARAKGIVRIYVEDFHPYETELQEELQKTFRLEKAVVVRVPAPSTAEAARRSMGFLSAPRVMELLQEVRTLGITSGRSLLETIRFLPAQGWRPELQVVQLMGNVGAVALESDALELGRMIARKAGGTFFSLNTPAFLPDGEARNALFRHEQVKAVRALFKTLDAALVGVGTLEDSLFIAQEAMRPSQIEELLAKGAVGEICGRFYGPDGKECPTPFRDQVISIRLEELARIPLVIGITSGADRAPAVAAALRGGLLKALVIDQEGARALLEKERGRKERSGTRKGRKKTRRKKKTSGKAGDP